MDQRANFLALILLDALEDENESDVYAILARNNIDASYVPHERGIAPLHYSCGMDNEPLALEFTKRFLSNGADPNVLTNEHMTPLHVAAIYGRVAIVKLLLEHGAKLDIFDDERKTPVHYAIEECHFEVVQLMRDHIFRHKYARKKQEDAEMRHDEKQKGSKQEQDTQQTMPVFLPNEKQQNSIVCQKNIEHSLLTSTPSCAVEEQQLLGSKLINKNLLTQPSTHIGEDKSVKSTPNRIHYNYDVTSPYYINITHRRHRPQPVFPAIDTPPDRYRCDETTTEQQNMQQLNSSSEEPTTEPVNIFTLTREHLQELSHSASAAERSRISLIELWREKVQRSRARQSILQQFDDVGEMIDSVVEHAHLNFTNTVLKEKSTLPLAKYLDADVDSGACGSATSSLCDATEYAQFPQSTKRQQAIKTQQTNAANMSLGQLIQKVAKAHLVDFEAKPKAIAAIGTEVESSYQTVPEIEDKENRQQLQVPKIQDETKTAADATNFIRSPNSGEYFLQMTEAYVHTDDENGLVFYETKLLSNQGNKVAQQRDPAHGLQNVAFTKRKQLPDLESTITSQSTNITIPIDYETDALRAELTTFGEAPGPITKSTKRLYIKRLIKYKRKTAATLQKAHNKHNAERTKFSVELHRTVRSLDSFERISEYMNFEAQTAQYFANHQHKKKMREGHLKQSFIYMLIDPRVSCNLAGESVFLEKFHIWKRFLESIFYVGKGKTSRPYSHLYAAMKTHSRMHGLQQKASTANGKKISIKKQALNVDLFKSPPQQSSDNKKLDRILDIWGGSMGVVCLHVFHNIVPTEAYTREAAIIDALSLQHLTNVKRGDYYGPAQTWTMREKKYLGIALLYKAMKIYLAEGESQLSPSDLI